MHRAMPWRRLAALRLADVSGKLTRIAVRSAPGVMGAGLITLGAGLIYWPAACFVGGVFLLVIDHRRPG